MKDFRRPDVNEPDVEDTDAPVITRGVSATGVTPTVSTTGSIVEAAFDTHAPQLKAFALTAVRDEYAADDLVQPAEDDRAVVQTGERIKKITSPPNQDSMVNELLGHKFRFGFDFNLLKVKSSSCQRRLSSEYRFHQSPRSTEGFIFFAQPCSDCRVPMPKRG